MSYAGYSSYNHFRPNPLTTNNFAWGLNPMNSLTTQGLSYQNSAQSIAAGAASSVMGGMSNGLRSLSSGTNQDTAACQYNTPAAHMYRNTQETCNRFGSLRLKSRNHSLTGYPYDPSTLSACQYGS